MATTTNRSQVGWQIIGREPVGDNMVHIQAHEIFKTTASGATMIIPMDDSPANLLPTRTMGRCSSSPTRVFGALPPSNSAEPSRLRLPPAVVVYPLTFDGITAVPSLDAEVVHHFHERSHIYAKRLADSPIGLLVSQIGVADPFGQGNAKIGFQFVSQRFASECFMAGLLATGIDLVIPAAFDSPGTAADRTEDGDLAVMRQGEILPTKGWPTRRWGAGLRRKGFSGWFMRPSLSRL